MTDIESKKQILKTYLQMKVIEQDWHGVADTAMDLRELEVELRLAKQTNLVQHGTKQEQEFNEAMRLNRNARIKAEEIKGHPGIYDAENR